MIENKHLGAYGIVIKDEKILLIKKKTFILENLILRML